MVEIVFKLSCFNYNLFKILNPIVCINIIKVYIWIQKLFANINYILRMHPSLIMLFFEILMIFVNTFANFK